MTDEPNRYARAAELLAAGLCGDNDGPRPQRLIQETLRETEQAAQLRLLHRIARDASQPMVRMTILAMIRIVEDKGPL